MIKELAAAFGIVSCAIAQPRVETGAITQSSAGRCGLNVAGVSGNVTVNCTGVDPKLVEFFNRELRRLSNDVRRKDLSLEQLNSSLENARRAHLELLDRFARAGFTDGLQRKANELVKAGKFDEAAAAFDELLAVQRKQQLEQTKALAEGLYQRAKLHEIKLESKHARLLFEEAARLSPDHPEYLLSAGTAVFTSGDTRRAEVYIAKAVDLFRETPGSEAKLADGLKMLGFIMITGARGKEGVSMLVEALARRRAAAADDPVQTRQLAIQLLEIGNLLAGLQLPDKGRAQLSEAISLLAKLTADPSDRDLLMAKMLLADLDRNTGRTEAAERAYLEIIRILRASSVTDANGMMMLTSVLSSVAHIESRSGRFDESVALAKEAINIARQLANFRAEMDQMPLVGALELLGDIYRSRNQSHGDAIVPYLEAMRIRAGLAQSGTVIYVAGLETVTQKLAATYEAVGQYPAAEDLYEKAVSLCRVLLEAPSGKYRPRLARALMNSGAMMVYNGKWREGEAHLTEGVSLYRVLATENPKIHGPALVRALGLGAWVYRRQRDVAMVTKLCAEMKTLLSSDASMANSAALKQCSGAVSGGDSIITPQ